MIPPYYVRQPEFVEAWHITIGGDWNTVALCGERPSSPSGYWTSRRKFHEERDPRLEVDARGVCGLCLLELPTRAPA